MQRWGTAGSRAALLIVLVGTLLRLAVAMVLPAGVDEAYTIGVARQFSISYFDHPPLHLWLVGATAQLTGSEHLWVLRLPFVLLGAVSSWLIYLLGKQLFGAVAGLWSLVIFSLAPVFGLVHGALILPDGPLIAASLGVALVVARIVMDGDPARWKPGGWALAGGLAALALMSKYHGVLLVLSVLLFLASTRAGRAWLRTPGPWLAAAIAALGLAPALIWNWQHDWASFLFQLGRGGRGDGIEVLGPLRSLGLQAAYLLPWIAIPLAAALIRGTLGGPANMRRWLLVCLAIVPVGLFTLLTLRAPGLPHWPMPGWLFAIPLLGEALALAGRVARRAAVALASVSAVLLAGLAIVVAPQARWGTFDDLFLALPGGDASAELASWDGIAGPLSALANDGRTFVAAQNWIRAGQINAALGGRIPVLCLCRDARHFAYLNPPNRFSGWSAIIVGQPSFVADDAQAARFETLGEVMPIAIERAGRVVIPLAMRTGSGFRAGVP